MSNKKISDNHKWEHHSLVTSKHVITIAERDDGLLKISVDEKGSRPVAYVLGHTYLIKEPTKK